MSVSSLPIDPETLLIDADGAREFGKAAAEAYRSKSPYPYGCFDNFMPPEILDKVREELRDLPAAEAAFDKALTANPKDEEARAGRAQVRLMHRSRAADLAAVRAAAADAPGDVEAQMAVADMDILGGQVEDAFVRLIDAVRVSAGAERDLVRARLLELFDVVGAHDERVMRARQALASALY